MASERFYLTYQEILQGDFRPGDLNLLLIFQVNCPGCLLQAMPVAIKLWEHYRKRRVCVLGLSTAFEDFDLNTVDNTRILLKKGELVGETKNALAQAGQSVLPYKIPFSIAFDELRENEPVNLDDETEEYCQRLEGFDEAQPEQKRKIRQEVRGYLANKKYYAETFDGNCLKGTPSWIIFNKDYKLLYQAFGSKDFDSLRTIMESLLAP